MNEDDTNANTYCLGKNWIVTGFTRRTADIYTYNKSIEPVKNVLIVQAVTVYDCPRTRTTYLLQVNEGIYYGKKLDYSLLNPKQIISYRIPYWNNPYDKEQGLKIEINEELIIPLQSKGTKLYFQTRVPTRQKLLKIYPIETTSTEDWNLSEVMLQEVKDKKISQPFARHVQTICSNKQYEYKDPTSNEELLHSIDPTLTTLHERIIQNVNITTKDLLLDINTLEERRTFVSTDRHSNADVQTLIERFLIGPKKARETMKVTKQKGMRSALLQLSRDIEQIGNTE